MTEDAFSKFEHQLHTYELFEQHKAALLADAREFLDGHPEFQLVGLILENGVPEAAPLIEAIETGAGQKLSGQGLLGVFPRALLVEVLRRSSPALLEWLPAPETPPVRHLAIAAFTKQGVQIGSFPLAGDSTG
ncbi:MAG: hypothetical protein IT457_14530 [Planctomycetes bacterium]|nr:hypothetical protein [Planctomycetota bacterium]